MDKIYTAAEAKAWLNGYDSGLAHAKRTYEKPTTLMMPNMEETLASFGFHKKKEWVGLTSEELEFYTEELGQGELGKGVLRAVDDFLREKNT